MLNVYWAMNTDVMLTCYMYYRVPFDTIHIIANKQQHLNKHITTGYPALDPTANKYVLGSGWEIMYVCVFMLLL